MKKKSVKYEIVSDKTLLIKKELIGKGGTFEESDVVKEVLDKLIKDKHVVSESDSKKAKQEAEEAKKKLKDSVAELASLKEENESLKAAAEECTAELASLKEELESLKTNGGNDGK